MPQPQGSDSRPKLATWNSATVHGALDPALLNAEVEISFSGRDIAATKAGEWLTKCGDVREIFDWSATHEIGSKPGACFMQGTVAGGTRTTAAIKFQDLLVIDCDQGDSLATIHERVRQFGRLALVATSHSHGKTVTDIKRAALAKWLGSDGIEDPTAGDAARYLASEQGFSAAVLAGATLLSTEHKDGGVMMAVRHAAPSQGRGALH